MIALLRAAARSAGAETGAAVLIFLLISLGASGVAVATGIAGIVFFRPLPYPHPDRLIVATGVPSRRTDDEAPASALPKAGPLVALVPMQFGSGLLVAAGGRSRASVAVVGSRFFSIIGGGPQSAASPTLWAALPHTILISAAEYARLGADPHLVGSPAILLGQRVRIGGVLSARFYFPQSADVWLVASPGTPHVPKLDAPPLWLGLLRPGATPTQAQTELQRLQTEGTSSEGPRRASEVRVTRLSDLLVRNQRQSLFALAFGALALLLISTANALALALSRAAARRQEFAIRTALGASPRHLVAVVAVEMLGLAVGAAAAATALAATLEKVIWNSLPDPLPAPPGSAGTLAFAAAGALAAALVVTLAVVALVAVEIRSGAGSFPGSSRATSEDTQGARRWLIFGETAAAVLLLVIALASGRALWRLSKTPLGFEPSGAAALRASFALGPRTMDPKLRDAEMDLLTSRTSSLLSTLGALPGAAAVAATTCLPLDCPNGWSEWVQAPRWDGGFARTIFVAGAYFRAIGTPIIRGAGELGSDGVVVSSSLEEVLLRVGQGGIGSPLVVDGETFRVVGVASDVRFSVFPMPQVYLPLVHPIGAAPEELRFVLRETKPVPAAVLQRAAEASASAVIDRVESLEAVAEAAYAAPRARWRVLAGMSVLAILLAASGVYSLAVYWVGRRTLEFGVRLALGATPWRIARDLILEVGGIAGLGAAGGCILAAAIAGLVGRGLGMPPPGSHLIALAGVLLLACAVGASLVPACRLLALDPAQALRRE